MSTAVHALQDRLTKNIKDLLFLHAYDHSGKGSDPAAALKALQVPAPCKRKGIPHIMIKGIIDGLHSRCFCRHESKMARCHA